jgi:hypothetical protein
MQPTIISFRPNPETAPQAKETPRSSAIEKDLYTTRLELETIINSAGSDG